MARKPGIDEDVALGDERLAATSMVTLVPSITAGSDSVAMKRRATRL